MKPSELHHALDLEQRLAEAEATIEALLSGQIDAVVDSKTKSPLLLNKAQDALRESEERYRRIVETANEGICVFDRDSKITFANGRLAELLGYEAHETLGMSLSQFIPQENRSRAASRLDRSGQGISEESEVMLLRKDGSQICALLKTTSIRDADGNWAGLLGMVTDRTMHRKAEEELRKTEQQYRQIVETTSDGIIQFDLEERIVFVNRRYSEMLGYEPGELIGKSVLDVMSTEARHNSTEQSLLQGKSLIDTTLRHKDGRDIAVNVAASLLVDGDGRYIGYTGVVRDVTERNKMQSQLMVSDRMASVGTLAAGVAHEINNPLAAVIANLDYIGESLGRVLDCDPTTVQAPRSDAWLVQEIKGPLDDARDAAQRVRFIVRDLKIFSRSPNDEGTGPVDVTAILESSLRMGWNEIRHRARLLKSYGAVPLVEANEARLGQVFLNLIVNAAQALQEGHAEHNEICLSTRLEGERVIIEVSDTGVGIPADVIGRIFDPFFTTKAVGVGTGLGLAICQRIVTDLGGELTVASEVGKGATFRVSLPKAHKEIEVVAPKASPVVETLRGRILVVDDEELVLRAVRRSLAKEHEVVAVISAVEALALVTGGEKFDLILCDLMMPDMTGMDFYRELVRLAPDAAGKLIFLTGGAFTAQARSFLAETSKEHIEKPFDPANLRAIVQRYLR